MTRCIGCSNILNVEVEATPITTAVGLCVPCFEVQQDDTEEERRPDDGPTRELTPVFATAYTADKKKNRINRKDRLSANV